MQNKLQDYRQKINQYYLADEQAQINTLLNVLKDYPHSVIQHEAHALVRAIREKKAQQSLIEAFLHEYQLNSEEGILLMEMAEALLRIPDAATQDVFLQEKLGTADWHKHHLHSESLLVNFATETLDLTGKLERQFKLDNRSQSIFLQLSARLGLPLIRRAVKQAMQQLAYQFVIAETIIKALQKANQSEGYLYSFDMLGEAALTASDADCYYDAYQQAITTLAEQVKEATLYENPSISIKLSALYSRYEPLQQQQAIQQISTKLLCLVKLAKAANITVTIDAEESERLEMSLSIFRQVFTDPSLKAWPGLGLAVQAYQKRALATLQYLAELAKTQQCKIPVRLVKGAYWDSEIKRAQVNGLDNYPVFTHKSATDLSYLACAQFMLLQKEAFYPQFATHNAHTVTAILELGKNHADFEFQRLHGMGEQLYQQLIKQTQGKISCRIYAPVGRYQELLPYLVRRLLENGANTSFINQVENADIAIDHVISDPVKLLRESHDLLTQCVLAKDLYMPQRINSAGVNLADFDEIHHIQRELEFFKAHSWQAAPLVNGKYYTGLKQPVNNPAKRQDIVGELIDSKQQAITDALDSATEAVKYWRLSKLATRRSYLLKAADLVQQHQMELLALCVREAGKTISDALAEIREAIDFCRYYAQLTTELFAQPVSLPSPTGEDNQLYQYGRGTFVCISPWNFPIAIFIGQIAAALASGNTVIAKPAKQTSLIAMRCIQLLHQAGIPKDVLHFLPGDGAYVGRYLLADSRLSGVAFTGSLATARLINQQLAKLPSIVPLIAETGGQNVMLADNSAHTEQLVQDVVQSAFNSAGQRCSALRVLYLPDESANLTISRIIGVMQQLLLANPEQTSTDIGPVIDQVAAEALREHVAFMRQKGKVLFQLELNEDLKNPGFFPPSLIEISSLTQLKKENFGPILHIIRYQSDQLEQVIEEINSSGYGLTLGIHSRINSTVELISKNTKVGNVYVNRNMISAVVGVQPFGGMGLSGTGPKAGGPNYLLAFSNEQTVTINTAAIGGNAELLAKSLN
ncbi:MAG: bifunctional proline dehydrogenase/L-glutamate gamma-semialdehyde dehydrogenase PutA [Methyloprofundus sp.]|nr:bifunctional proline dehydrogenase/L-glutamate gamma-semialdehyde dehydrogenase PutA [Methyloprofundus sp.]